MKNTSIILLYLCLPLLGADPPAQSRSAAEPVFSLDLPTDPPDSFRVHWTHAGEDFVVDLRRRSLRAATFSVVAADGARRTTLTAPPVCTYRGTRVGHPGTVVAASLFDTELTAALYAADGRAWFLAPAGDGPHRHRFGPGPVLPHGFCGTRAIATDAPGGAPQLITGGYRIAQIAFDADHDYYRYKGASVAAVVAAIEAAMNASNAVYERDVDISHRITQIVVRTSEPDPYDGNDAGVILDAFRAEWNANQTAVVRDTAHFVTSRAMGNILGLAWVGVICNRDLGYGLSRFGTGFGTDVSVLTHELGHNWSAPHCLDACDVMCGCGAESGFGPNDQAQIEAYRDTRTCLGSLYPELVAHYRLDEPGGTVAADATGNGHDATLSGAPLLNRPGAASGTGSAVHFDGQDDRGATPAAPMLDRLSNNFSLAAWVNPDTLTGVQRIFGNVNVWAAGFDQGQPSITFRDVWSRRSTARINAGIWTHVAFVVDEDQFVTFYVDGINVGTITPVAIATLPSTGWFLGARSHTSQLFSGLLDDVQIYDGVLSDAQIAFLHARPGATICAPRTETYGTGLAGARSVPTLELHGLPLVGASVDLRVTNSGDLQARPAALLVGPAAANIPFFGGTLLVDPLGASVLPFTLLPIEGRLSLQMPRDRSTICGDAHLQAVEVDAGAPQGLSFTPGLRVRVGG